MWPTGLHLPLRALSPLIPATHVLHSAQIWTHYPSLHSPKPCQNQALILKHVFRKLGDHKKEINTNNYQPDKLTHLLQLCSLALQVLSHLHRILEEEKELIVLQGCMPVRLLAFSTDVSLQARLDFLKSKAKEEETIAFSLNEAIFQFSTYYFMSCSFLVTVETPPSAHWSISLFCSPNMTTTSKYISLR